MVRINLLPWREQARTERMIRFGITVGFFAIVSVLILVCIHLYFHRLISMQNSRTTFLQTEIEIAQTKLFELKDQKEAVVALKKQLDFVVGLRARSLRCIHLLTALEDTVPQGLSLEKVIREDNAITVVGRAKTDLQITLFMKNLEQLRNFTQPVLTEISSEKESGSQSRYFKLKIQQED